MTAAAMDRSAFAGWQLDPMPDAPKTLKRMAALCHSAMTSAYIVRYSNEIIAADRPRDLVAQIETIRAFLMSWFFFVENPIGVQRIRTPLDMIADIEGPGYVMGACNDAAVLVATLGMANGIEARFRAVAFSHLNQPDETAPFTHVITDLSDRDAWHELDVTKPLDLKRPPNVVRTLTMDL